jgi:hypothetical protein
MQNVAIANAKCRIHKCNFYKPLSTRILNEIRTNANLHFTSGPNANLHLAATCKVSGNSVDFGHRPAQTRATDGIRRAVSSTRSRSSAVAVLMSSLTLRTHDWSRWSPPVSRDGALPLRICALPGVPEDARRGAGARGG